MAGYGNLDNMRPLNTRSEEEIKRITSAGGVASGKARRNKKILKDCLEILLEKKIETSTGKKITGAEALSIELFQQALDGNTKAFEVLRDTAGQKPVEKIMVAEVDQSIIDEVEKMMLEDD